MSEQVRSGLLRWDAARNRLVIAEDGGANRPVSKPGRDLAGDLNGQQPAELDGIRVDFTWHGGQARAIRRAGTPAPERKAPRPAPPDPDVFRNPYTFIPAPSRDHALADLADSGKAGPPGHHRLLPERWTGRLAVTLTTETPLLLLDTARRARIGDQEHYAYPVLTRDGAPHLPATAVKGMLRSAYEAITNSRFGVFSGHTDRLSYRMAADDARHMIPARVSEDGNHLILLPGDTKPGDQLGPNPILHAAWLPLYGTARAGLTCPPGWRPSHGDEVQAYVELFQHYWWDKKQGRNGALVKDFQLWRVRSLTPAGGNPPPAPEPTPAPGPSARYVPVPGETIKLITGQVCITNRNIGRKHDERIFFQGTHTATERTLGWQPIAQWEEVIRDYRAAHREREIYRTHNGQPVNPWECKPGLGNRVPGPGETAWSPHQYDDRYLQLTPGRLCYARVDRNGNVTGVYPVMISRALYSGSPESLLPESLRPAAALSEMSPADRVFGWTHGDGAGGYRGHLRIGPVRCDQGAAAIADDPADFGEDGVPLAILGQPKPQQGRFYLAAHRADLQRPLPGGLAKDRWYSGSQGLRGRKFYAHHAGLASDYWDHPAQDRTQQADSSGRYQEYRRPGEGTEKGDLTPDKKAFLIPDGSGEQRDDQNSSVRGWVRPGSTFRFTIEVQNLSEVELGALVWLLSLPSRHFHRLGYGKPLGFGSVRLDVDTFGTDLRLGADWISRYRSLRPAPGQTDEEQVSVLLRTMTACFTEAVGAGGSGHPAHVEAFLAAARGDPAAPVHYPRTRPTGMDPDVLVPPDPRGRSFEWFRENERRQGNRAADGRGRSLPGPNDGPLPVYPAETTRQKQP